MSLAGRSILLPAARACLRHESNHTTEVALKTMGDLADMRLELERIVDCGVSCRFCFSSLLSKGSIYHDLLMACKRVLFRRLEIVYEPLEAQEDVVCKSLSYYVVNYCQLLLYYFCYNFN